MNPITPGEVISEKEFRLDVLISLNNMYRVNIEMQVVNQFDWPDRSLSYLCRTFDNLNHGQSYQDVQTAIHISLLNYTLFPETPEFYSSWRMMNQKTHQIYSDKLQLYVVCLTKENLATEEDRKAHLDQWARLFRASTWEEVKMIVKDNPALEHTAECMHRLTEEEIIQYECLQRERMLLFERSKKEYAQTIIRELEGKNDELKKQLADREAEIMRLKEELGKKQKI